MVYRDIWVVIKLISQERMAQTTRFPMKNPKKISLMICRKKSTYQELLVQQ